MKPASAQKRRPNPILTEADLKTTRGKVQHDAVEEELVSIWKLRPF
jgi:hypothetical protein